MKLTSIHIDNFGKLKDFDIDFESNPCIVLEENGWGKTTLAAFIKVMFYGFEGESKRSNQEKERVHYLPWDLQGSYGGKIIFEHKGKEYELTRHFAKKAADDEVHLRDVFTGLESRDFDVTNLGEELFDIDMAGFMRTVFIAQGRDVANQEIGGKVHAKVGDLTRDAGDVGDFEKLMDTFKEKMASIKSGHKKGELNELTARISGIKGELRELDSTVKAVEQDEENLRSEQIRFKELQGKLKELDGKQALAARRGQYKALKEHYTELKCECERLDEKLKEDRKCFEVRVPKSDELDAMIGKARELKALETEMEVNRVEAMDTVDLNNEDIQSMLDTWKKAKDLSGEVNTLKVRQDSRLYEFKLKKESTEQENRRKIEEYDRQKAQAKEDYEAECRMQKTAKSRAILVLSLGIACVLAGVAAGFILGNSLRMVFETVGLLISAIGLGMLLRVRRGGEPVCAQIDDPLLESCEPDEDIAGLAHEIEQKNRLADTYKNQVAAYMVQHNMVYDEDTVERELYNALGSLKSYEEAKRKQDKYSRAKAEYDSKINECDEYIISLGAVRGEDRLETLQNIKSALGAYNTDLMDHKNKSDQLDSFLKENDFDPNATFPDNGPELSEIENERARLEEEKNKCSEKIENYKERLEKDGNRLAWLEEEKDILNGYEERCAELKVEYDIIDKASEHMRSARERLIGRYVGPLKAAFDKYYSYIQVMDEDGYRLNANIELSKSELGEDRAVSSLSTGYRDLADLALRIALVEVMYKEDKPFIVLDDPFVNLDDEKLKHRMDFLEALAQDYQVIYFTCHRSRA